MAVSQNKFKTNLIRAVADHFVVLLPETFHYDGNDVTINNAEHFRKIISDGHIDDASGPQDQQLVLYEQDYQSSNTYFDDVIDIVSRCYCNGTITSSEDQLSHICVSPAGEPLDEYTELTSTDLSQIIHVEAYGTTNYLDTLEFLIANDIGTGGNCGGPETVPINQTILNILSQFVSFDNQQIIIDPTQAQQVLDTNIFELMPQTTTRQQLINKFFTDYGSLVPPSIPNYNAEFPLLDDTQQDAYETQYSVDDNPTNGYIPRLNKLAVGGSNETQTIEWLRDNLNDYLRDIDAESGADDFDDRPEHEDKSEGYLKIRHMNQAIIVRKEEGTDVGIDSSYLTDGFTITMWVKFLDQINSGTLFNFGNPLRENNPMGFMLETFIVNENDSFTNIPSDAFINSSSERFIRLVVKDDGGRIRDSHVGTTTSGRLNTAELVGGTTTNGVPALEYDIDYAFNYTKVPINLTEWYFIVANYNPFVDEDIPGAYTTYASDSDYWRWNKTGTATFTSYSGLGARCKVEIISKSDLIRARGFRSSE